MQASTILHVTAVIVLFFVGLSFPSPALTEQPVIAVTTPNSLNVRAEPNSSARVVATLKRNTFLGVTGLSDNWARVMFKPEGAQSYQTGWVSILYLRVVSGGGDSTYSTSNGAEFTLTVDSTDLDCRESYIDDGYDRCEVEVSVSVSSNYNGNNAPTISYSCEASLYAYDTTGFRYTKSDSDSSSVYGREGYDSMSIDVRVSSYIDPIVRVKLDEVSCEIDDVY